ncbi:MAG TPA: imidazoleglycerol-phosphate dehydratase HisB [Candidatus Onthenecus intestinigallinarum]|uniref:Imidazoleglycerol-phosphate dehydratase n=1 Tax=Candidatus Onthenecus intestinigallinarum TaxID=2840875 RepID=A0A9D0ZA97_9FIRM|nr:imidazoleglycerol-phosphate dehydratase HisB [Candidatus Onthenecus intestinigallinarum]
MRTADIARKTGETDIRLSLALDGQGRCDAQCGIGFFEHMLSALCRFGLLDLTLHCEGDLHVDAHHTVEDVGICLGQAIAQALGDKRGIARLGHACAPMDEALALAALDVSGRPYLVLDAQFDAPMVGAMDTQLVREFFRAVATHAGLTLHLRVPYGQNDHHKIEALFKAFGRALRDAVAPDPRIDGVLSTKGVL